MYFRKIFSNKNYLEKLFLIIMHINRKCMWEHLFVVAKKKIVKKARGNSSGRGVILVTGSSGRIGAALVKRLGENHNIIGFERVNALYASSNEELVPVDVSSDESMKQAFDHIRNFYGNKIKAVVHLAAYYSFEDQKYKKYKKITVEGTKRLLKHLQEFRVEQFIFSSTMLVHKPNDPKKSLTERSPLAARWAYPKSKIETEGVIHKHRGNIPSVILRISGVYDDQCHSIPISHQIQRIYEGHLESHFFPGDVTHGSSFMHMDDLIDAICKCIQKRKSLPKMTTLLLGESKTLSVDDLQKEISMKIKGEPMRTWRIPKALAFLGAWLENHMPFIKKPFIRPWMIRIADDHYSLNISKAKRLLNWEPKHNLEDSLSKMITDLKRNPKKWYIMNGLSCPNHIRRSFKKRK